MNSCSASKHRNLFCRDVGIDRMCRTRFSVLVTISFNNRFVSAEPADRDDAMRMDPRHFLAVVTAGTLISGSRLTDELEPMTHVFLPIMSKYWRLSPGK